MSVYRIHLKPGNSTDFKGILEFCKSKNIIGTGWGGFKGRSCDPAEIKKECDECIKEDGLYPGDKGMYKSIHAVSQIKDGDFIWTREGGSDTNYYLFKAEKPLWTDRIITSEHTKYGVENYVCAKWVKVGTQDKVPGHVVNSFRPSATAQHVYDVDAITSIIWNQLCKPADKVKEIEVTKENIWNMIGNEELECVVLLYLQSLGYYIYSSTLKSDTKTYETVMIKNDGSHLCYPQVKQGLQLLPHKYVRNIAANDKVFLFSSIEDYGNEKHKQVTTISRQDIWDFMVDNMQILPGSVKYWMNMIV